MNEITEEVKKELATVTHDIVTVAQSIVIKTEIENVKAATLMAGWKQEKKRRVEIFAPSKKATKNAYDEVRKLEAAAIDPIEEAITLLNRKVGDYVQIENNRRAELQRQEDERVDAAQAKEEERISKAMAKAEESGKPVTIIPKFIAPARTIAAVSAPAGTAYVTRWSAKVVDLKALCLAVAEGRAPEYYITAVMHPLNAVATSLKREGEIAPGVIAVSTTGTSQRG